MLEILIICACVASFVAALILAKSSRNKNNRTQENAGGSRRASITDRRAKRPDPIVESIEELIESSEHPSERPKPFDPTTAKPAPLPSVIHGAAYVVDGDTIVVQKTQIRLYGIDAPEIDHPFGKKAKWALVSLCKGKLIRAEVSAQDAHGRTVAKCYLPDGSDLSAEMVKQGMALDWPKYSGGVYGLLETPDARKRLWLADARQKGRMHVGDKFEAKKRASRT